MVIEEVVSVLPLQVADNVFLLVRILQALGVVAIIYLAYMIITGIINYKRLKKLQFIEEKVSEIDKKLNTLLRKRK